jgi:hypothetical protein
MAGYSGKPLAAKLDIKPGHRVLLRGATAGFAALLAPLPPEVTFVTGRARAVDCAMLFTTTARDLEREFSPLAARLTPAGLLWVAWPKQASRVETDLTESVVRRIGLATGLVDVKVCAVTEVWSGLKFVRRLKDR